MAGQYLGCKAWSMAPGANSCHMLCTLKTQSRSVEGLDNDLFVRFVERLPSLDINTRVERSKAWRGRATMSLIAPESGRMLFCALTACAAAAQELEARAKCRSQISVPLLAMGSGVLLFACGIIPPLASVYELTDVTQTFTDAGATLKAFWFGALGTILGTLVAFKALGSLLGPEGYKIASSLCATYIGGSFNYAATAQAVEMSPSLLALGMAADNLAMAVYLGVIFSIPEGGQELTTEIATEEFQAEPAGNPTVESLALTVVAAASPCMIGNWIASVMPPQFFGLAGTTVVASVFSALEAMIDASTQVKEALAGGWPLFGFIFIVLSFLTESWFNLFHLLIASNANVGGPATAAAIASARRWQSLVRPALLVSTLGYTIGTTIGCLVDTQLLQPMPQASLLLSRA